MPGSSHGEASRATPPLTPPPAPVAAERSAAEAKADMDLMDHMVPFWAKKMALTEIPRGNAEMLTNLRCLFRPPYCHFPEG